MSLPRLVPWVTLLFCAGAMAAISDSPGVPKVRVEVQRHGDAWTADFNFDRPVAAWVFPRSDLTSETRRQWRQQTWSVATRGVRLQRRGHYDVLTAERGELPRRVTVRFKPDSEGWRRSPPALVFSDGSVALFVAQFDCFPMDSIGAVRALPRDLNNQLGARGGAEVRVPRCRGPGVAGGRRSAVAETPERETYVLFGAASPVETPDMIGILDPQLPAWIKDSLTRAVPALIGRYTQELGALRKFKPAIMVSWEGATRGISSRAGSTLRGLIAMRYAGAGMLRKPAKNDTWGCGSSHTRPRISGSVRP